MDEQERQLKLQAGKEALQAFQKRKKAKKKKKPKPDSSLPVQASTLSHLVDEGYLLNQSEPILPHSASPLPPEDSSHPSQTTSLPPNAILSVRTNAKLYRS
jgi:hypothetical protein